jgi:endogenous inhibitor of DNA gyrase (YacG/DUF329 family)
MERLMRRFEKLLRHMSAEDFADYLIACGKDEDGCCGVDFFFEVWQILHKRAPSKRPWPECAECGRHSDSLERSNTRYCSAKCRQKAYRKRVTEKTSLRTAKRNERDTSMPEIDGRPVTQQ